MVKYPYWVQKLLNYTIQHEGGRHIDFRQMSISPGETTGNNSAKLLSAYMSSRALATTTTSSLGIKCEIQVPNIGGMHCGPRTKLLWSIHSSIHVLFLRNVKYKTYATYSINICKIKDGVGRHFNNHFFDHNSAADCRIWVKFCSGGSLSQNFGNDTDVRVPQNIFFVS